GDGTRPTLRGVAARAPAGRGRPGAVPQGRAADPGDRPAHGFPALPRRRLTRVGDRRLFLVGRLGRFERRLVGDDLALPVLLRAVERLVGPLEERGWIVLLAHLGHPGRDREAARLSDRPRRDRS